jgi:hypothetical protein
MAAIVALGFLVVDNGQNVQIALLGNSAQFAQGWTVAGAAARGFVLAFLLPIPGRLASAWQSWSLSRQGERLEERLQGLLEEHQRVLSQMLAPVTAAAREPAPAPLAMPAAAANALQRAARMGPAQASAHASPQGVSRHHRRTQTETAIAHGAPQAAPRRLEGASAGRAPVAPQPHRRNIAAAQAAEPVRGRVMRRSPLTLRSPVP